MTESKWKAFTDRIHEQDIGKEYKDLDDFWARCKSGYKMAFVLNEIGWNKSDIIFAVMEVARDNDFSDNVWAGTIYAATAWAEINPITQDDFRKTVDKTSDFAVKAHENEWGCKDKAVIAALAVTIAYVIGTGDKIYLWHIPVWAARSPNGDNLIANKLRERFQPRI